MEGYRYSNWARTQSCTPELYYEPTTEDEIKQIIKKAREERKRVKVQGFGHSQNDITCTDGYMINLKKMDAVINVDEEERQVTVQAGCSLGALGVDILPKYNLALPIMPPVWEPTIVGAISTGTHNSGKQYGNLGSYVVGLKLLTAGGDVITCTKEENSDKLRAAVCGLGCLGIILEVTIKCEPAFQIHSIAKPTTLDKILGRLDTFLDESDYARFWWMPHTDNAVVVYDTKTKDEPIRNDYSWFWTMLVGHHFQQFCMWIGSIFPRLQPLIHGLLFRLLANYTVDRVDASYNMFRFHCGYSQWINEWGIPIEKTEEVLREIQSKLGSTPGVYTHGPFEVRFVKGDDGMLSTCYKRDTCFLSLIHYRPYNQGGINTKSWQLFEDIVKKAGGRPHWAKNHSATASYLRSVYPEWDKFSSIREKLDPEGIFLNDHLERLFEVKTSKKDA